MASRISIEEANDFMGIAFETKGPRHVVTHLDDGHAVVRLETDHTHLRPGGYISGPTQMARSAMRTCRAWRSASE